MPTDASNWNALRDNVLVSAGIPEQIRPYAQAMIWLESNGLQSNVSKKDNNYTGITWLNKPYQKATKGLAKPKADGGGFYAHFPSWHEWAADYKRILSLAPGYPVKATSLADFVNRLKQNKYFGLSAAAYLQRLQAVQATMNAAGLDQQKKITKTVLATSQAQANDYKQQAQKFADENNFMHSLTALDWKTWALIGAGVLILSRR